MYQEFFSLKIKPFSISPDPNFLFLSERHKEAITHLKQGLQGNSGFALLTGEVGTGKTTLCRSLIEGMDENSDVASILNPALSEVELLSSICDSFNIEHINNDLNSLFNLLAAWISTNTANNRRTIVLIDEAQHLSFAALEQLRLLTNIDSNNKKTLQVILIGQTELQEKLKQTEFRQLAQSITARYHLLSLSQQESNLYIQHRLNIAGSKHDIFDKSALLEIYNRCSGTPRLTNILCDRSLLAAYAQDRHIVTLKMVQQASKEIHFTHQASNTGFLANNWRLLTLTSLLCMIIWQTPQLLQRFDTQPLTSETTAVNEPHVPNTAPVVPAVPVQTQWFDAYPQLDLTKTQYSDALVGLYTVWGYEVNKDNASCDRENGAHITCYSDELTLQQLKQLNYPSVVGLQAESGRTLYAVLYQIADDYQLLIDGNIVPVSEQWFKNYWSGETTLLWQAPFALQGTIKYGQQGERVHWLARKLNQLQGLKNNNKNHFDTHLLKQVMAFQYQQGLIDDGIVGPHTLMVLMQQTSPYSPRLLQEKH